MSLCDILPAYPIPLETLVGLIMRAQKKMHRKNRHQQQERPCAHLHQYVASLQTPIYEGHGLRLLPR
jgi:hypothetical protein